MSDPTDPFSEAAKATQEVAKATGEVAKATDTAIKTADKVGQYFGRTFGDAIQELAGFAYDKIAVWRFTNLIKQFDDLDELLKQRRLEGKTTPLPDRISHPLLRAMAEEDREPAQELYVKLLANGLTSNADVEKAYIRILSEISDDETRLIPVLARLLGGYEVGEKGQEYSIEQISDQTGLTPNRLRKAFHHLASQGCFRINPPGEFLELQRSPDDSWPHIKSDDGLRFYLTDVGLELLIALSPLPEGS